MFLLKVAKFGPIKADNKLDKSMIEIAFGIYFFSTLSAAANLYCAVKASPNPRNKFAIQNNKK